MGKDKDRDNDDDEIEIDFSKIKGWFSGGKKHAAPKKRKDTGSNEDNEPKEKRKESEEHDEESDGATSEEDYSEEDGETAEEDDETDDEREEESAGASGDKHKKENGKGGDAKAAGKAKSHRKRQEENDDSGDDLEIDFSKIKGWFSGNAKAKKQSQAGSRTAGGKKHDSQEEEEDIQISGEAVEKAKSFFKTYWPYLLIIIPLFLAIFVRFQTVDLAVADDWARNSVNNYFYNQVYAQVKAANPNLPDANLESLANQQYTEFLKANKAEIDNQVTLTSSNIKLFFQYESNGHPYPYMGDIDSYYFLRQARNLVDKGMICDVEEDGICYDTYTIAPLKRTVIKSLHPHSIVAVYRVGKIFNSDFTLMQAQIITPTIYAVIAAGLIYIMMFRLFGPVAAITASVLLSVNPILLSRSLGSDTDIYNVFFPILIIFFAFEAFTVKGWKKKAIFSALAGLSMGAYSFAWIGWWYMFDFIVIAIFIDFFFNLARESAREKKFSFGEALKGEKLKDMLALLIPLVITALVSVGIITGFKSLKIIYTGIFSFMQSKVAANPSLWPNVLTTVAEFNESSIAQIIGQMGGQWWFFFALLGFIVLIYRDFKRVGRNMVIFLLSAGVLYYLAMPNGGSRLLPFAFILVFAVPFIVGMWLSFRSGEEYEDIKLAVLFFIWIAASIYAALKGVRFALLLVPPIAIGIGISFGFLHDAFTKLTARAIKARKGIISFVLLMAFMFFLITPVRGGLEIGKGYIPSVNDQWWEALSLIKENSQPDAIINSWWDFGHWFKFIADRRVTLDGSSQNSPQLHWLGKSLLTSDENQARGILRMLDCGGNEAFDAVEKKINFIPESVGIVNQIILLKDREEAMEVLKEKGFSVTEAEEVLQYSHCNAPENFFITSEDMIGKGGVWAHFGSWNFNRAYMHQVFDNRKSDNEAISLYTQKLGLSREEASKIISELKNLKNDNEVNAWIAPWPSYLQGESACTNSSEIVRCTLQQASVEINLTTMEAYIVTPQGLARPNVLAWTTPTGMESRQYSQNLIGVGMVLIIKPGGYSSLFMAPELTQSMFTRLYYLDGHGLSYFDPFYSSQGLNGFRIKTWKVSWEGRQSPIVIDAFNTTYTASPVTSPASEDEAPADAGAEAEERLMEGANITALNGSVDLELV